MITTPPLLRRNYRGCYACLISYTSTLSQLVSCASSWTGSRHKLLGGSTGRATGRKRSRGSDSIPQPVQVSGNYSSLRQVDTREIRRWRDVGHTHCEWDHHGKSIAHLKAKLIFPQTSLDWMFLSKRKLCVCKRTYLVYQR